MAEGHGGPRPGSGRPKKPLSEAILEGARKSQLKTVKFPASNAKPGGATARPKTWGYLKEAQKDAGPLLADRFYKSLWEWLCARKCENLFDPNYLQRFAMQQARCVQLEQLLSQQGFLTAPPDGPARVNPLEDALTKRLKIVNQMQYSIERVVRENCTEPIDGLKYEDPMERLLNSRKG